MINYYRIDQEKKIKSFENFKAELKALGYDFNSNEYKKFLDTAVYICTHTLRNFREALAFIAGCFKKYIFPSYVEIYKSLSSIYEVINEIVYGEDSHDGQGVIYKKLSRFYKKEREKGSRIKIMDIWHVQISIIRKTTSSLIMPVKNKSWKGNR